MQKHNWYKFLMEHPNNSGKNFQQKVDIKFLRHNGHKLLMG